MFMLSVLQPQPEGGSWDMQNCGPDFFGSEWIEITCEFPEGIQTVSVLVYVTTVCFLQTSYEAERKESWVILYMDSSLKGQMQSSLVNISHTRA